MNLSANLPDLVISLSRDKVRIEFSPSREEAGLSWQFTYPIQGIFFGEQISNALNNALMQNPSLIDQFENVEIVLVDAPAFFVPQIYADQGHVSQLAGKYLRLRRGDTLTMDSTTNGSVFVYSLPTDTIHLLREYYANASHLHLNAVLWNNLCQLENIPLKDGSRIYFSLVSNSLIVLGESEGKLMFSKSFIIRDEGDLLYFLVACSRIFPRGEYWHVSLRNEVLSIDFPKASYFSFNHHLELPELRTLIAQHRLCES